MPRSTPGTAESVGPLELPPAAADGVVLGAAVGVALTRSDFADGAFAASEVFGCGA
ncbi:hypothetical protein [Amnibacterium sp.]|uniref:hypothetical protein n=1 Tax=Amnibacterium sp. TaxID=1872496 RepID=UPI002615D440|nr:hypothetical protein [Amnibacterium sp.]